MAEYGPEWTASVRAKIMDQIRGIQPKAGKNLKDVEIPPSVYKLANSISKTSEARVKFSKVPVYDILREDLQQRGPVTLDKADSILERWKTACNALFRYALNLILAPTRVEFKKMKLSTSFYVYKISHNLHHADRVLITMGYAAADKKESHDLVYSGDVKTDLVLETATDLLVMHEEIGHLKENVSVLVSCGRSNCTLEQVMNQSKLDVPRDQEWTPPTGSPRGGRAHFPPPTATSKSASEHEMAHQVYMTSGDPNYTTAGNTGTLVTTGMAPPTQAPVKGYVNFCVGDNPHIVQSQEVQAPQEISETYTTGAVESNEGGANSDLYANLPISQSNLEAPREMRQLSYQERSVGGTENFQGARRASEGVLLYDRPLPTSSIAAQQQSGWDGIRADRNNPTEYQNKEVFLGYVSTNQHPPTNTYGCSHPAQQPTTSTPITTPQPKPRSKKAPVSDNTKREEHEVNQPGCTSQEAVSEDTENYENQNILVAAIKGNIKSPSTDSIDPADLPPPVTNFTSLGTGDYYFVSGIRSGLISGIDSDTSLSYFDPDSSRGPAGLHDRRVSDSNSSGYSVDIYGSGSGFVRQQSSIPVLGPLDEEVASREQGEEEEKEHEGEGLKMSLDNRAQALNSSNGTVEVPLSNQLQSSYMNSEHRKNLSKKSMSVDEAENSGSYSEKNSPQLRNTKSGTNLAAMAGQEQGSQVTKPSVYPRNNLLPSSPSPAPRTAQWDKSSPLEDWIPPKAFAQPNTLYPVTEGSSRGSSLPRQANSVDGDPGKKAVPRFSSGSNLLSNQQPQQTPQQKRHIEPDTPVMGVIPPHLQKKFGGGGGGGGGGGAPQLPVQPQHTAPSNTQNYSNMEIRAEVTNQKQSPSSANPPHLNNKMVATTDSQAGSGGTELGRPDRSYTYGKDELKQKLEQEQQQRITTEKQLKVKEESEKNLQQQLEQQKQEKDEIQKKLRDLEHQLQQQQQQKRQEMKSMPLLTQQKSVAIVSPTNAEGKPTTSKGEEESHLDYGGEGARALKDVAVRKYPGEDQPRSRANASSSSKSRPKRLIEQETSFNDPLQDEENNCSILTKIAVDSATHLDIENTWVCEYCTNLNADNLILCDVCKKPDPRKFWTCLHCENINRLSLSHCKKCRKIKETTI